MVELHEDLAAHYQTRDGAWRLISQVPGVKALTDLEYISADTLTDILMPQKRERRKTRRTDAVGPLRG